VKDVRSILFSFTLGFVLLLTPWTYLGSSHFGEAYAATVIGPVTFVGVVAPDTQAGNAIARVRITNGECETSPVEGDLWIIIGSGNLNNSIGAEINSLNMKSAYSTVLAALLSGKRVQIDGLPNCTRNARGEILLNLPTGNVGVF
jgi:hypothetical protein